MPNEHEQDNGINNKFVVDGYTPIPQTDVDDKKKHEANGNCNSIAVTGNENTLEDEYEWVVPDGGWGWFVLLAAVMVNLLIPGTVKSFGVLFMEFLEVFDASSAAAAWIPALCYFLYSSLGPLSSILSVKYSYRTVTLIGGTFAAVGMMSSYFATSVGYLCISYGILVGTGAGLSFPPTVYIVTSYFDKYKGIANGLCISGSAMGSIILPPILGLLLNIYGYRGAVLIMGALTLNVWAGALLYEPVEKHLVKRKIVRDSSTTESQKNDNLTTPNISKAPIVANNNHNSNNTESQVTTNSVGLPKSASSIALQNYKNHAIQWRTHKVSVTGSGREISGQMHSTPALYNVPEKKDHRSSFRSKANNSNNMKSLNYVSTPFHGSTLSIIPAEESTNLTLNAISSTFRKSPEKDSKNKFFDISLLQDPLYLVILISNSTNAVSYTNFVILLPAYASSLNFSKDSATLLLSVVSVFDLVGRIGGSSMSDLNLIPKHWYFVGGLFLSGMALTILPFATSYVTLAVYCSIFGLASGVYVGITTVIMADMLGQEKLTSSYGISLFVNGIIQLIGPPLCGLVYMQINSYGPIFMTLGLILSGGAMLWGIVPFIRRRQAVSVDSNHC